MNVSPKRFSRSRSRSVTPGPDNGRSLQRPSAARRALLVELINKSSPKKEPAFSRSRSRSVTPGPDNGRSLQPPSAARRALLVELINKSSPKKEPTIPIPGFRTPSWDSLKPPVTTPGGSLCKFEATTPLLCTDILERAEAMDLSDEEAQEIVNRAPWHVQRWMQDINPPTSPQTEGSVAEATSIKTDHLTSEVQVQNSQEIPSVPEPVVRPSTSKITTTGIASLLEINQGSDLDSEFDDEFDLNPLETTALAACDRDIPNDDDLDANVRGFLDDAQRVMDNEIDRLPGISNDFVWEENFQTFQGRREKFLGPTPGSTRDYDTPYEAFTDIWDTAIMEQIALETNRYAKQTIDFQTTNETLMSTSRLRKWHNTNVDEMYSLLAIFMYMGVDIRSSQYEYWKTKSCTEMPKFRQVMSYNRYVLLNRCLHFVDNSAKSQNNQQTGDATPKLRKLIPIIEHLNTKFMDLYNLEQDISIDESLTLFKGRLSWSQTIRTKAARFGIKSYELCESKSGYLHTFQIYTGKQLDSSQTLSTDLGGKTTKVVLDLLQNLQHRGHCVTMDNFYNSPALARYLKSVGFDCLGTLRVNRKNVPKEVAEVPKNVDKGTIVARHSGDVSVLAWKDSRVVTMISTYHSDDTCIDRKAGKLLVKPISVRDYNNTMGGVDLKDQKLSMYLLERKRGLKWYIKMFKRLLNVSIHNAFILLRSSLSRRNYRLMTHREFRYELADALINRHCQRLQASPIKDRIGLEMRLKKEIVHKPRYESGRNTRKRCVVCYRKGMNKMVHSRCGTCEEYLCFTEHCWEEWHSLPVLKGQEYRGRIRGRR